MLKRDMGLNLTTILMLRINVVSYVNMVHSNVWSARKLFHSLHQFKWVDPRGWSQSDPCVPCTWPEGWGGRALPTTDFIDLP